MRLSKANKELFNEISSYSERIATNYYLKHRKIFSNDSVTLDDLKQEAKLICVTLFKKHYKQHGVTNFDVRKFIARAVGWKLRDMMSCAITESIKVSRFNLDTVCDCNIEELRSVTEDDYFSDQEAMCPDLKCGFNISEIYKRFSGKDLTILKNMLKYDSKKSDIRHLFPNDKWSDIKYLWKTRIKPKVKSIISKLQQERFND